MNRILINTTIILILLSSSVHAQFATVGGGLLVSERPIEPVVELNFQSPPFYESRAYITISWMKNSVKPTLITAIEHSFLNANDLLNSSVGVGILMIEPTNYKPDLMLVNSTIVPLPVPRTSFVLINSVLPFKDYDWSIVLKVGWAIWFNR